MHVLPSRKWFCPLIYLLLLIIAMLPPVTEVPLDPRHTQDVILAILMVSIISYQVWGWIFHVATLFLVALVALQPQKSGQVVAHRTPRGLET